MSLAAMLVAQRPAEGHEPWLWVSILATCAAGLVVGEGLSRHVSAVASYRMLLALTLIGGLAAATRGGLTIAGV